jgi:phage-related baseplate assembly protein
MENITESFPDISFIDDCTVDDVLTQMINDYQTKYKELTGKEASLAKANPYRLIMYACTVQIYQAMQYADYAGKMSFLKYANGDYLDNLAALRGVKRTEATAATTVLQFSLDAAIASAVSIPAGCRATNGNGVYFATDKYAEIPAGETTVSVSATCTDEGSCGNDFAAGEFNVVVNTLPYVVSVTNTETTSGGADREDDDSLKNRIFSAQDAYSTAGPKGAYEYFVLNADPTISNVVVDAPDDQPGTVNIYFICDDGELPSDTLIQKVSDYLNDRDVRPLTDHVLVKAPETATYDIDITYYIPSSMKSAVSVIQSDVDTAVSIYNTWQTEKIGRDINPSYLIQKVMEAGAKRVEVTSPSFTVMDSFTVARTGTVSVTYGGVEDD